MPLHIDVPKLPQFHFEWHDDKHRLYVIHPNSEVAELVSETVHSQEAACFAVQMWASGYKARCHEFGGRHYRMYADPVSMKFS